MGRFTDKTVLVTGAARGQGRSHAVSFAREGANVVALDVDKDVATVPYSLATVDDMAETRRLVEEQDRQCLAVTGDVRSQSDLDRAVEAAVEQFGQLDVLVANAGVMGFGAMWELSEEEFLDNININFLGVWRSIKAVAPRFIEQGSGSIVVTASSYALEAGPNCSHYVAGKHGVVGLVRAAALELAPHGVRCNAVCPGVVDTPMNHWQGMLDVVNGGPGGTIETFRESARFWVPMKGVTAQPSEHLSRAVLFLASDDAIDITGVALPVDAGHHIVPGFNPNPAR